MITRLTNDRAKIVGKCDGPISTSDFPDSDKYSIGFICPNRDTLPCRFFRATNAELFAYSPDAFEFGEHFLNAYFRAYGEMPLAESYKNPREAARKLWARASIYFLENLGLIERKERDLSEVIEFTGRLAMAPNGSLSFNIKKDV